MSEQTWEPITKRETITGDEVIVVVTHRLPVFGGWMVRTESSWLLGEQIAQSESSIFVPDPNHEWTLEAGK